VKPYVIALRTNKAVPKNAPCDNSAGMSIREEIPLSKKERAAYLFFFSVPSTSEPIRKLKSRGTTKDALTIPVINADSVDETVIHKTATVNTDDPRAEIPSSAKVREKFFFRYDSSSVCIISSLLRMGLLCQNSTHLFKFIQKSIVLIKLNQARLLRPFFKKVFKRRKHNATKK
jgi:hypothetical protein